MANPNPLSDPTIQAIVEYLVEGHTGEYICANLHLTKHRFDKIVMSLRTKYKAANTTQLVAKLFRDKLIK